MSIKVSSINFKKSPLNFTATKKATVINNETTRKSVQLETDNSVFSAKSETLVLEPVFYASSTIYFDENGLIQNSSGEYFTTSQGYGIAGYTNSHGVLTFSTMAIMAIDTPVLTVGVEGNITGTSNSSAVNVYYRLSTDTAWTLFKSGVTVTAGAWTATGTIPDAGTYDFKVEDSLNPSAYATVDDVEVESGVNATVTMDATASASTPESIINEVETQSMGATCSASTPTAI